MFNKLPCKYTFKNILTLYCNMFIHYVMIDVYCSSIISLHSAAFSEPSALLWQSGGVQVRHGSCLDLEGVTLDVVAGDLLAGLADGDGLAALAADMNGLAVLLPTRLALRRPGFLSDGQLLDRLVHHLQRLDGSLCDLEGLRGTVVCL